MPMRAAMPSRERGVDGHRADRGSTICSSPCDRARVSNTATMLRHRRGYRARDRDGAPVAAASRPAARRRCARHRRRRRGCARRCAQRSNVFAAHDAIAQVVGQRVRIVGAPDDLRQPHDAAAVRAHQVFHRPLVADVGTARFVFVGDAATAEVQQRARILEVFAQQALFAREGRRIGFRRIGNARCEDHARVARLHDSRHRVREHAASHDGGGDRTCRRCVMGSGASARDVLRAHRHAREQAFERAQRGERVREEDRVVHVRAARSRHRAIRPRVSMLLSRMASSSNGHSSTTLRVSGFHGLCSNTNRRPPGLSTRRNSRKPVRAFGRRDVVEDARGHCDVHRIVVHREAVAFDHGSARHPGCAWPAIARLSRETSMPCNCVPGSASRRKPSVPPMPQPKSSRRAGGSSATARATYAALEAAKYAGSSPLARMLSPCRRA